ncbi:MAG TPA: molybdenum cofactor guanylyltransferase [Chthoniobacteraceae bacterium]|nr:molybdenum cofactor guanylyltransferase [Chthoniobacteraceae bacterium]
MKAQFTAALLAGGKSSRMGRDKAQVEIDGVPLWRRQLETLRRVGADEILVSGPRELRDEIDGVRVIADEVENCGPLSGIHALLGAAAHPFVLVLAIDMPAMAPEYLGRLAAFAFANGSGAVSEYEGCFEPLAAIYPAKARAVAAAALRGGDYSLQKFVAECVKQKLVAPLEVAPGEAGFFENLNTPIQLAKFSA